MTDEELDAIEDRVQRFLASPSFYDREEIAAFAVDAEALVAEVRRLKALVPGERGRCSICGQPYHRYAANDPEHDWSPVACINSLRGRIEDLEGRS